jgi:hypothetical protein
LRTNSTNDTILVVSWAPPANPNGDIHNYSVSIINLADGSIVRQVNTDISDNTITETELGKLAIILRYIH